MKRSILFSLICFFLLSFNNAFTQGWVAEVMLDLNHNLYAYEKIYNATFTYSGVTVSGTSATSTLHLVIKGTGSISGDIRLTINGLAWEPYYRENPYDEPIAAVYSGNFKGLCSTGFYEKAGETPDEQVYIWIKVYPRLEISRFINNCNELSFTATNCSAAYTWEVSENIQGPYHVLPGKNTASVSVTREELSALPLSDPYGQKYFRVTGRHGTTSLIQPMSIYYPPPTASISAFPPKCHLGADGSVVVYVASSNANVVNDFVVTLFSDGHSEPLRQEFINDGSVVTFPNLRSGNYWIEVENNTNIGVYGNCKAKIDIAPIIDPSPVTIPDFDVSNYNGYAIKCNGGNDGTLEAKPFGGTGTYTSWEWTPDVGTTALAKSLREGTYKVKVKDSNGCWSDEFSETLTAPKEISVEILSTGGKNNFDVSCHNKADGIISVTVSGGVAQYSYFWSDGSTTSSINGVAAGNYTVRITDANQCTKSASTTLIAPDRIQFEIAEIAGIICSGDDSGILEVRSLSNTIGQVYYHWSSGEKTREINNKSAGSYSVTVSDDQGCNATKLHELVAPLPWSVEIIASSDYHGSAIRCHGEDNGQLTTIVRDGQKQLAPANSYTWYRNGIEFDSGTGLSAMDGLAAGTYTAEITYNNFCKAEKTFSLNEPTPVKSSISQVSSYNGVPISCHRAEDATISATASGGTGDSIVLTWNTGQTGPDLAGIGAGVYVVTAKDINGCEGMAEKILKDPDPVIADITILSNFAGQPVSCAGESDARLRASASGGVPLSNNGSLYHYEWHTGDTLQNMVDVPAGTYQLTVHDANGCEGRNDTTIISPPPLNVSIIDNSDYHGYGVTCHGSRDGFLLSAARGGTGSYSFLWAGTSHTDSLLTNLAAGSYSVKVTDENGCSDAVEKIITAPPVLKLESVDAENVRCYGGSDGEISLVAAGGAGEYLYSVSRVTWQKDSLLKDLKAGTYEPVVRDANGCEQTTSVNLAEPPPLNLHFENIEPALCGDHVGKVSASATGGTGAYKYLWTQHETFVSEDPNISGLSAGIYTLKVSDEHTCEAVESVGITSHDGPEVIISSIRRPTCSYSTDGSVAVEVIEGHGPYSFLWHDGQKTPEAVNLKKGEQFLEIKDTNNCAVVKSITLTAPDSLSIELLEKAEPACNGDCNGKIAVAASGGNGNYMYDWGEYNGSEIDQLCAGHYGVKVVDKKGCTAEKTFALHQPDPLSLALESKQPPLCHNGCDGKLALKASGGTGSLAYLWSTGVAEPEISNLCAGSYTVTVSDENSCEISRNFIVDNPEKDELDLGGGITLCEGQTHILDPGSIYERYDWGSNTGLKSTSKRVTISEAGSYWLRGITARGCLVQDTFLLHTSTGLLKANFLLTSEALVNDTVTIIEISWPVPENIIWAHPHEMEHIADYGDIVFGKFQTPGQYEIALFATLGECRDRISKSITILDREETPAEGRLGDEPFLRAFAIYPNPNDGIFDVRIEFVEESPIVLTVWNSLTAKKISKIEDSRKTVYALHIDLRPLSPGTYTMRLDYRGGTQYRRFIVR